MSPSAAELAVDVFQTPTDIVIETMVAGVKPEDFDDAGVPSAVQKEYYKVNE